MRLSESKFKINKFSEFFDFILPNSEFSLYTSVHFGSFYGQRVQNFESHWSKCGEPRDIAATSQSAGEMLVLCRTRHMCGVPHVQGTVWYGYDTRDGLK